MREKEMVGGSGLWAPHIYGTMRDEVFFKELRFSPSLSFSLIPPLII